MVADRLPEGYASIEEYANRTAQRWRVGDHDQWRQSIGKLVGRGVRSGRTANRISRG